MPTQPIRTLSPRQIEMLRKMPLVGTFTPSYIYSFDDYRDSRTWHSLRRKGLVKENPIWGGWEVLWGKMAVQLFEQIQPGSTRQTFQRELQRLNDMALDFSEGSNANFMRQITVVKNLREMLIKAEK